MPVHLAKMGPPVASMVGRENPILRDQKPSPAVPSAPAIVGKIGPRRPAVLVIAAAYVGIVRLTPVFVDVVHLFMAVAMIARLSEGGRNGKD